MKYFKNIPVIAFLLVFNQRTFAQKLQFENSYWMPKIYVNGTKVGMSEEKLNAAIKPIESILIQKGKIYIKTFKDEFKPSGYIVITKNEIVLKTVMINLAQPIIGADPILNKFSKDKFYLFRKGKNTMFLIIKGHSVSDTVQFIQYSKSLEGF
jgi:hypothetical protein